MDHEGNPLQNGDPCLVVAGTHRGRAGTVEDLHRSPSGALTLTVREPEGSRFKTLAKNVRRG